MNKFFTLCLFYIFLTLFETNKWHNIKLIHFYGWNTPKINIYVSLCHLSRLQPPSNWLVFKEKEVVLCLSLDILCTHIHTYKAVCNEALLPSLYTCIVYGCLLKNNEKNACVFQYSIYYMLTLVLRCRSLWALFIHYN